MEKLTQKQLNEILEKHRLWLLGKGGERAVLSELDLSKLDFSGADLRDAIFRGADLRRVILSDTDFSNAILSGVDLSGVDLRRADFRNANLRDAIFCDADFSNAILRGAILSDTDFSNAILTKADLDGADLRGAIFRGADLTDVLIYNTNLQDIDYNKKIYQVTDVGSRSGFTYFIPQDNKVLCGCWNDYKGGTLEEFKGRVESVYGKYGEQPNEKYYKEYQAVIKYFKMLRKIKEC